MNVYLTGFMGSGKTAVGRILADRLGFSFFDTDTETVDILGTTIADYVKRNGEDAFREKETAALTKLSAANNAVIATGGGTLLTDGNAEIAKKRGGVVVFINTPFFECFRRIANDVSRPLAFGKTKAELNALYAKRLAKYGALADYVTDGAKHSNDIADDIIKFLNSGSGEDIK